MLVSYYFGMFVSHTHLSPLNSWCSSLNEKCINYRYLLVCIISIPIFPLSFFFLLPYLLKFFYLIFILFHGLLPHVYFILVFLKLVFLKIQLDAQASLLILKFQAIERKKNETQHSGPLSYYPVSVAMAPSTHKYTKLCPQKLELYYKTEKFKPKFIYPSLNTGESSTFPIY